MVASARGIPPEFTEKPFKGEGSFPSPVLTEERQPSKTHCQQNDFKNKHTVNCSFSSPALTVSPLAELPARGGSSARGVGGEARNVVAHAPAHGGSAGERGASGACPTRGRALGPYRITETERRYSGLIWDFKNYLSTTSHCKFRIHGTKYDEDGPDDDEREIDYINRWHPLYRKAVISKFYQLEDWWMENPTPITLLTLTTYQDGDYSVSMRGGVTTIEEGFCILKKGWRWLSVWLRKHHPDIEYITVMEPHKTGYPHMHVILFGEIPPSSQARIRELWTEKYKAGSFDNGVDFEMRSPAQGIRSIRNYVIKYLAKTFFDGKTGSRFEASTDGWTRGELLFNAVMWKNGWRLWGASLALSRVMAYTPAPSIDGKTYVWDYTELVDQNGDEHTVSKRGDYVVQQKPVFQELHDFPPPEVDMTSE